MKCKCGCGEDTGFYRNKENYYIHGHNGRGVTHVCSEIEKQRLREMRLGIPWTR